MRPFSIAIITCRQHPEWEWLTESLKREFERIKFAYSPPIILVDAIERGGFQTKPKPTIWQGKYRVTKEDWFANSNARNTALCLCETEWVCFFDDRCVLMPGYLDALSDAMDGNYIMAGAYEKRTAMTVKDGVIENGGIVIGEDGREEHCLKQKLINPLPCGGDWLYGANFAGPLEWFLQVNGYPEIADGMGFEDVLFGLLLQNNGYPIKYDTRAKVIQDRTPELCLPSNRREDKGRGTGPQSEEKAFKLLKMFQNPAQKTALHIPGWPIDLRQIRTDVLARKPFPSPPDIEFKDFYDGQPIKEFA